MECEACAGSRPAGGRRAARTCVWAPARGAHPLPTASSSCRRRCRAHPRLVRARGARRGSCRRRGAPLSGVIRPPPRPRGPDLALVPALAPPSPRSSAPTSRPPPPWARGRLSVGAPPRASPPRPRASRLVPSGGPPARASVRPPTPFPPASSVSPARPASSLTVKGSKEGPDPAGRRPAGLPAAASRLPEWMCHLLEHRGA